MMLNILVYSVFAFSTHALQTSNLMPVDTYINCQASMKMKTFHLGYRVFPSESRSSSMIKMLNDI